MTPMELGTAAELDILRDSLIAGVLMGMVCGVFRVVRLLAGRPAVGFVCDLLCALVFGAAFFIFSLDETNYFRGFILFGMLAGALMWCATLGRLLTGLMAKLLGFPIAAAVFIAGKSVVILHKLARLIRGVFVSIQPKSEMSKKKPKST